MAMADIAQMGAGAHHVDGTPHRCVAGLGQALRLDRRLADANTSGWVSPLV